MSTLQKHEIGQAEKLETINNNYDRTLTLLRAKKPVQLTITDETSQNGNPIEIHWFIDPQTNTLHVVNPENLHELIIASHGLVLLQKLFSALGEEGNELSKKIQANGIELINAPDITNTNEKIPFDLSGIETEKTHYIFFHRSSSVYALPFFKWYLEKLENAYQDTDEDMLFPVTALFLAVGPQVFNTAFREKNRMLAKENPQFVIGDTGKATYHGIGATLHGGKFKPS